MAKLIENLSRISAAGNKPKLIDEIAGRVNNGETRLSLAHMRSPAGWIEPGQTPEFDEYTYVLRGMVRATTRAAVYEIAAGQAFLAETGEWVQYSTPDGAEYIAVCLPAFSPENVHRDA